MNATDIKLSRQLFEFARSTTRLRNFSIFSASHLIWLMAGFAVGRLFPHVYLLMPMVFLPWGVCLLLSEWIRRIRPYHAESYKPLIHLFVATWSFPSSHSTLAFSFVAVFLHDVTIWPFFLVAALLVVFGRVAVGVHYFSDVLIGALLGFGLGLAMKIFMLMYVS